MTKPVLGRARGLRGAGSQATTASENDTLKHRCASLSASKHSQRPTAIGCPRRRFRPAASNDHRRASSWRLVVAARIRREAIVTIAPSECAPTFFRGRNKARPC
jgi:hypothetical protein